MKLSKNRINKLLKSKKQTRKKYNKKRKPAPKRKHKNTKNNKKIVNLRTKSLKRKPIRFYKSVESGGANGDGETTIVNKGEAYFKVTENDGKYEAEKLTDAPEEENVVTLDNIVNDVVKGKKQTAIEAAEAAEEAGLTPEQLKEIKERANNKVQDITFNVKIGDNYYTIKQDFDNNKEITAIVKNLMFNRNPASEYIDIRYFPTDTIEKIKEKIKSDKPAAEAPVTEEDDDKLKRSKRRWTKKNSSTTSSRKNKNNL